VFSAPLWFILWGYSLMAKHSAGLLMYRRRAGRLEVFLVHPGGPYWRNKDLKAWSIPKGEYGPEEDPLDAARREFAEETGFGAEGNFVALSPITQAGGKVVHAWALEGDLDPEEITSNTFTLEWPPKSGKEQEFPEVDKAGWFDLDTAREKINQAQVGLLEELEARVGSFA
jgi:predicted NUDIX family NTP pyrophosphohydrolase